MPDCGSQIILCDVPVRFDTYEGCSHGCKYCFAMRKRDIRIVERNEGVNALKRFIQGERTLVSNWCDWNIPLHWGGLSDPFQPIESEERTSLSCLEIFAESKYPFIVSTKGIMAVYSPYIDLLKQTNCVYQVSIVCPEVCEKFEPYAPTYQERIDSLEPIAEAVKRVIVRCQPYIPYFHESIKAQIKLYADRGVYGVVYEALKLQRLSKGMIKVGSDFVYPRKKLEPLFKELREECHRWGLQFYAGENRLRRLGDSLCCCGIDGLEGFRGNNANLNHYFFDPDRYRFTDAMKVPGSAYVFKALAQDTPGVKAISKMSYEQIFTQVVTRNKNMKAMYFGE